MTELNKINFTIQCIDVMITSDQVHEVKAELDKDYKYVMAIAISDIFCSSKSIIEQLKIKGKDILPEKFEAIHIMCSKFVDPNKRFFSWFEPVAVSGDELVLRFRDPGYTSDYNLQMHVLLTNNPEEVANVLFA